MEQHPSITSAPRKNPSVNLSEKFRIYRNFCHRQASKTHRTQPIRNSLKKKKEGRRRRESGIILAVADNAGRKYRNDRGFTAGFWKCAKIGRSRRNAKDSSRHFANPLFRAVSRIETPRMPALFKRSRLMRGLAQMNERMCGKILASLTETC